MLLEIQNRKLQRKHNSYLETQFLLLCSNFNPVVERIVFLNGINLNGNERIKFYFKILLALPQVPEGSLLPQTKTIYIKYEGSVLLIQVLCMSTD